MIFFVSIINININPGRNSLLGNFPEMSSVNALRELLLRLPNVIKDTGFEVKVTNMEKGKTHV